MLLCIESKELVLRYDELAKLSPSELAFLELPLLIFRRNFTTESAAVEHLKDDV